MTAPTQLFNFDTLAESAISLFGVSKQDVKYHIEKVGGLNNTSKILDIAPVDAEFLIYAHPSGDLKEQIEFSKHSDGNRWHWNQIHGWFKSQMTLDQTARLTSRHCAIPLIELRQEYTKESK